MLFEEAAREYMDDKSRRLRACTLAGYESALALHVLPRWGGVELESIAPEDVQSWGMVRVDTDGNVYLTHMYGQDEIVWATVDVSVTFAA